MKYGGEIMLALYSYNEPTIIRRGERVAQLVSTVQPRTLLRLVSEEEITNNREGFGSTGTGNILEMPSANGSAMYPVL